MWWLCRIARHCCHGHSQTAADELNGTTRYMRSDPAAWPKIQPHFPDDCLIDVIFIGTTELCSQFGGA